MSNIVLPQIKINIGIIFFVVIGFLLSPKPYQLPCGKSLEINKFASFYCDCDALDFVEAAKSPSIVFSPNFSRQSRPIYIFIGSVLGKSTSFIISKLTYYTGLDILSIPEEFVIYGVFVIINFIILFLTLQLFQNSTQIYVENVKQTYLLFSTSLLILLNPVVKVYFWTAHQQMFILFTPVLCVYIVGLITKKSISYIKICKLSILLGFCLLIYGNFILVIPCIVLAWIYRYRDNLRPKVFLRALSFILLFAAPQIFWILIIISLNGHYYNDSIQHYRQFIWIFDLNNNSISEFFGVFLDYTSTYFYLFLKSLALPLIILIVLFYIRQKKYQKINTRFKSFEQIVIIVIFIIFFIFFWFLGYYAERLLYYGFPLVLLLIYREITYIEKITPKAKITVIWSVLILALNVIYIWWPFPNSKSFFLF